MKLRYELFSKDVSSRKKQEHLHSRPDQDVGRCDVVEKPW